MSSDTAQTRGHVPDGSGVAAAQPEIAEAAPPSGPSGPVGPGTVAGPTGASPGADAVTLPARDREVLAFERQWWRYAGAKEAAIRERFGMSATRYYQVLNTLVDRPEALAADPLLVRRLRRMRAARQRPRPARPLGSIPPHD